MFLPILSLPTSGRRWPWKGRAGTVPEPPSQGLSYQNPMCAFLSRHSPPSGRWEPQREHDAGGKRSSTPPAEQLLF